MQPTATASQPTTRQTRPRMSDATIAARAAQRAHDEHVHIFAVPGRSNLFTTKSKSDPSERYSLVAGPDGIVGCSCKGFEYRQSCKHAEALRNRLAREAVAADRQARRAGADDVSGQYA